MVLYVATYDCFTPVLSHGVDIVPLCPELTAPEFTLHLGMLCKDVLCGDTLCDLDYTTWCIFGDCLDKEVYVVFVRSNLVVADFVALLYTETALLERCGHLGCEDVTTVLYGTDDVVEEQVFVVSFYDVVGHCSMIPPTPRSRAARKSF